MNGNSLVHLPSSPGTVPSSSVVIACPRASSNGFLCFPPKSRTRGFLVRASSSSDAEHGQSSSFSEGKGLLTVVLNVPRNIWRQTLRPLSDFGFGHRSVWEGGVGLFIVSGAALLALSLVWLRGFQMRPKFRKYQTVFEFPQASGICTGTTVRIRGVNVGNVIRVNPSLKNIEAVAEIDDDKIIIPRNSLVEVNQSGLLMETMIDITPRDPIPGPSVGPLHPECDKEGLIVCDWQKIMGYQGIQPLLSEFCDSGLLKEVENLTQNLTQDSEDLRYLWSFEPFPHPP
ncbi:PREDICTED: protein TRIGALACTOSYLDIACYLGLYCEROL 2, chloroplastic-like isoform X2 [Tarenaya hassleriana]|uniref:protein TRIGALACTOSYLDIACYLGLYCEROL 2, chloroplastic-like isoform X2 n=1 Tax=Tarenaya hassleriana TaxID=28532 RepID=UPI0008FD943F|nr:PREDICTED: protein TRIGALACTOSYLDIACYLGLYCEROL 2, chloroplastic-like isoform X2 [Tarenaya hassleriana]